jgi:hypothetical protein
MFEVTSKKTPVNLALLTSELRTVLGATVLGASFADENITVHLSEAATSEQAEQIIDIIAQHDAAGLTPEQASEKARAELLTQMRQERQPLDPEKLGATANDIKAMGRRIALLELEIDALRGR